MKICLIDLDSKIPNLPLMKLSTYHKKLGDEVTLVKVGNAYYPTKKKINYMIPMGFDKYYCSIIFDTNKDLFIYNKEDQRVVVGGSGVSLTVRLPEEVEKCEPDYSIYPDNDTSYGFITKGCIRRCYFCVVPIKDGKIRLVNHPRDIIRHSKVDFLDDNFLAYEGHVEILKDIAKEFPNVKIRFSQGLDIRLLNEENSYWLSKVKYRTDYIFAFDDIKYMNMIERQVKYISWIPEWKTKFYVYCHPKMQLRDTIIRIEWLRERQFLPYLMRDISCYYSEYNKFYTALATWCNQPRMFKKMRFDQFVDIYSKNKNTANWLKKLYEENRS